MAQNFSKNFIKDNLTIDDIFELLQKWGGDPEYTSFGILSSTICHHRPEEGSRKLYYYENSGLFRCYTGCDSYFDIFELNIKVNRIQKNLEIDLNESVREIAYFCNILEELPRVEKKRNTLEEDKIKEYNRIQELKEAVLSSMSSEIILKEYDSYILEKMNYKIKLMPWIKEGIKEEILIKNHIGYYVGGDQISIPHFDIDNRLIGLRGRGMCKEENEKYGKYRPIRVNDFRYNHPLGLNLYNLNNSKENIKRMKKAIIFEGEKSTLLFQSIFGADKDISVACCGSSVSSYQMNLLLKLKVEEIIIAFDRQFQEIGDEEFQHLTTTFQKIQEKYKAFVRLSFLLDKRKILSYKASPIDEGKDKFLTLIKDRVVL